MHYLKAVKAAGTTEENAVMKAMRDLPIDDVMTKGGRIREDGRVLRDFYVFRVRDKGEMKEPWDYYERIATVPADEAARPIGSSECNLVKR